MFPQTYPHLRIAVKVNSSDTDILRRKWSLQSWSRVYLWGIGCTLRNTESHNLHYASLVAASVKNPPAMQETWVWSLGWEDPLEKKMRTYSSVLAWKKPMDGGAGWATVHSVAKSWTRLSDFTFTFYWKKSAFFPSIFKLLWIKLLWNIHILILYEYVFSGINA